MFHPNNKLKEKTLRVWHHFARRGNTASAFWGHLSNLNIIKSSTHLYLLL